MLGCPVPMRFGTIPPIRFVLKFVHVAPAFVDANTASNDEGEGAREIFHGLSVAETGVADKVKIPCFATCNQRVSIW